MVLGANTPECESSRERNWPGSEKAVNRIRPKQIDRLFVFFCPRFFHFICSSNVTIFSFLKGSVAALRNTRVGTALASCIPGVAVLAVLAGVV